MAQNRILVVDDDANLLELIRMRLEASGYEVTTALDERVAGSAVRNQNFDLAILDLQLVDLV